MNEVGYNFNLLSDKLREKVFAEEMKEKRYGHQLSGKFRFTEFDRFKDKLINSDSEIVANIQRFYDTFYRMDYTDTLEDLNEEEIIELGNILNLYEKQYN